LSPSPSEYRNPQASCLIAAIAINLLLGTLYGWSLLLVPLEDLLKVSRTSLSLVPALALLCFTAGVYVHDALVRRLRLVHLASGVTAAAGLGHLIFWLLPSYPALIIGYGGVFGSAAGVGYGLALALARMSLSPTRGWTVGLTVAAFAAGGMTVSAMGALYGVPDDMPKLFAITGGVYLASALALGFLLRNSVLPLGQSQRTGATDRAVKVGTFLRLAVGYFALCYLGLMLVSHGAAILEALGVSVAVGALTPFVLNAGYIIGAFLGGVAAARAPGRATPLAFLLASAVSAFLLSAPVPPDFWVAAVFVIGLGFGSTVSVFVVLLTSLYGADRAGVLFGRLNISYGLAGLLSPSITGWLYELGGSYDTSLWLGCFLGSVGLFSIAVGSDRPRDLGLRTDD
jgi:hypothetical protein